jgi:hypothetical protein
MNDQSMETIIQRFNGVRWHDSKLLGLSFYRAGSEEQVKLSLQLWDGDGTLAPADLVLHSSTYVQLDVDLGGKRVCADDISGAECHASSEWIRMLSEGNPHDSFAGYLHFEIGLIPPGGTINVLAKDFIIRPVR